MRWWVRLARALRARRDDGEVDAEIRLHVELETEELVRQGVPRGEARRRALLAFGGLDRIREEARDARRLPWLDTLRFDLRHAFRSLRRSPGFTFVAVVTLAIGVGANASLYALVDALMFRPPEGVSEPERLVVVDSARNYVRFLEVAEQSKTLSVAAYTRTPLTLDSGPIAAEIAVECVTASYFRVLGTQPLLGRVFSQDAAAEAREPAIVLSHGLWQRRFGGDRSALSERVSLAARTYSVVGVMPRDFTGVMPELLDAWILLPVSPEACAFIGQNMLESSRGSWLTTIGRLAGGVTLAQAEAEVAALASPEELFRRASRQRGEPQPELRPLHESRRARVARDAGLALWLLGGAAVVLLIACANVAGLLSIRSLDRRRETAVRLQLGATRGRVLRQFFLEQCLLAAACAAAALAAAAGVHRLLDAFFPYAIVSAPLEPRISVLAAALALAAAITAGVVPAVQTCRVRSTANAQSSPLAPNDRSPFRSGLLVIQVGLAFVLVVGAGLFVRSVQNTRQNLGYDPDGLYVVAADLRRTGFTNPGHIRQAFERIAQTLGELPFVQRVGLSSGQLLGVGGPFMARPRMPRPGLEQPENLIVTAVTPSYFSALGARILRGRAFTSDDHRSARRVAIIDEATASEEWPGEDALGKCGFGSGPSDCRVIVGIVESRRRSVGSARLGRDLFIPLTQSDGHELPQLVLVRANARASDRQGALAAAARTAVPNLPYVDVRSFDDLADAQTRSWRLGQTLFGWFGFVGVCLSALGLYALLALAARQRTTEIGVRMALGARPVDIARLVLGRAAVLVGTGWLLGLSAALMSARSLESLLFEVQPTDASAFAGASIVVLLAGAAGCLLPAARAAAISPVRALRHE